MRAPLHHLVVVGGGPAGVMAAVEGTAWGMAATVIDEQLLLGGQFYRTRPDATTVGSPRYLRRTAPSVHVKVGTSVFDAPSPGALTIWSAASGADRLEYDSLVLATGAYDRPVPLPGWTLPGVLTAGAAHSLASTHGVIPGRRVIVAGAGPFLLEVADVLQSRGCQVTVVQPTRRRDLAGAMPALVASPSVAVQAVRYQAKQIARRWTARYGELVTAIHGEDCVRAVSVVRVDREWRPVAGSERQIPADAVCLGFGFVPDVDLCQLLGCSLNGPETDFSVVTDGCGRTSIPHVYAAGESRGVGGVRVARLTGQLAGLTAAFDAGLIPTDRFTIRRLGILARLWGAARVASWIRSTFSPRPGLWSLATGDTIVCRCEDVTVADLERPLAVTAATPVAVKTVTRAGMGLCQGRMCSPFIIEWLRVHDARVPLGSRPWSVRPPVRPIPLAGWAADPDRGEHEPTNPAGPR